MPDVRAARAGIRSLDCGHDAEHDIAPITRESVVRRDQDRRTLDRRAAEAPSSTAPLASMRDDVSLGEQSQAV